MKVVLVFCLVALLHLSEARWVPSASLVLGNGDSVIDKVIPRLRYPVRVRKEEVPMMTQSDLMSFISHLLMNNIHVGILDNILLTVFNKISFFRMNFQTKFR